ncbi:putative cytochrome P450 [Helianthus debilis subsp. tardiflorus]
METWFIIVVSLCIAAVIRSLLVRRRKLPPGPPLFSASLLQLINPPSKFEPLLINLKARYGPLITLSFGFQTNIFVGSHSLAHQVLVQKGAVFSDRPKSLIAPDIATSSYGPSWRILRRNLVSEIMHPSRIRTYSWARKWGIKVVDHFQYAMFCLLVFMCFGEKFDESKVNEIAKVHRDPLLNFRRFRVLTTFPKLGKILFRNRWKELEKLRSDRDKVVIRLIKSRIRSGNSEPQLGSGQIVAYVDTLVNLRFPEEDSDHGNGERLTLNEMATICSEFLNGGTDTTTTALQWIMANLVKHPRI